MKKRIALLLGLTLGFTAISCSLPFSRAVAAEETNKVTMYRLYNPNSGEHFYTGNESEKTDLVKAGWRDEGIGWIAPVISDTPVYRLYNGNAGDHHYTLNVNEKDNLVRLGWKDEGVGWYSDDEKTVPLYREYNPNAVTGTHNYTTSKTEHDNLVTAGWKDEGIGWYAIEKPIEPEYTSFDLGKWYLDAYNNTPEQSKHAISSFYPLPDNVVLVREEGEIQDYGVTEYYSVNGIECIHLWDVPGLTVAYYVEKCPGVVLYGVYPGMPRSSVEQTLSANGFTKYQEDVSSDGNLTEMYKTDYDSNSYLNVSVLYENDIVKEVWIGVVTPGAG